MHLPMASRQEFLDLEKKRTDAGKGDSYSQRLKTVSREAALTSRTSSYAAECYT